MAKKKPAPKMSAPLKAMQAGNYSSSLWFAMFVALAESRYPGVGKWIEAAADLLPWDKLVRAVMAAIADWQEGKSFLQIFKEALSEWLEIESGDEIRMALRPEAEPDVA